MKLRTPVFFWLLVIFIIMNAIDLITAMYILPGESNPLYILFNSIYGVLGAKLLLIILLISVYLKNDDVSEFTHYTYHLVMVMGFAMLGLGIYSNIIGMMHPAQLEAAAQIPAGQRAAEYGRVMSFLYLIPMVLSMAGFWFHQKNRDWTARNRKERMNIFHAEWQRRKKNIGM